jgi:hypothetical protein
VVARLQQWTPRHGGLQVFRFPSTAKCVSSDSLAILLSRPIHVALKYFVPK